MTDNTPDPTDQIGKFFDVVPPHKTAASPTSRPVITSSPPQNDPMVKESVAPVAAGQPSPTVASPNANAAGSEPSKTEAPSAPSTSTETTSPDSSMGVSEEIRQAMVETHGGPPPPDKSKIEPVAPPAEASQTEPESKPAAVVDMNAQPPVETKHNTAAPAEKTANQVIVKHHQPTAFWRRTWFILLALIILIVIVDLLLDAGIIKTTFPHTHFFNKN